MSDIPCNACDDLKTYAPDFVVNGVTAAVCSALQNDKGLNASNGRNNATDLQTAIDCLVGVLVSAIETYDVCDWQDFMKQFLSNNYELLSALICNEKGQWNQIHSINAFLDSICPTIDNIFKLIQGDKPRNHTGEWTQLWIDAVEFADMTEHGFQWEWQYFKPTFRCQIDEGAGCDASKRLGRYLLDWAYLDGSHYPYVFGYKFVDDLTVGDVIATIPKSAVVPTGDMSESRWKDGLRSSTSWLWGTIHGDTLLYVDYCGYTIIDGVVFNPSLAQYGEDTMVVRVQALVGASTQGNFNGSMADRAKSYNT